MKNNHSDYFRELRKKAEEQAERTRTRLSDNSPESLLQELKVHQVELEMQNQELRDTQYRLQKALDDSARLYHQSPVGYATLSKNGRILDANESLCRMLDMPLHQVRDKYFAQLIDDEFQSVFRQRFKAFYKSPIGKTIEVALVVDRPVPLYVEIQGYHLPVDEGQEEQPLAINIIDKSTQRSIENSLFLAENIISVMPDGVMITEANGIILNVNPTFTSLTGYSSKEVVGQPAIMLRSRRDINLNFQTILHTLEKREIWQGRLWYKRKDKSEFFAEVSMTAVYRSPSSPEPLYHLHIIRDITRQTNLEKQLQETQKMEALGTMVSGLAHNFNNLLAGIKGNLFLLQKGYDKEEKFLKRLKNIDELSERSAELIKQLLSFARKNQEEKTSVNLCELVTSVVNLHRAAIPETITLDVSVPNRTLTVNGNKNQLMQALLNILINSVHALRNTLNPTISIVLEYSEWSECGPSIQKGPVAILKIIDNGCGIAPSIKTKIFDPFFTTKDVGEGSGLGLSMVYGTIKDMNGVISVDSDLEKGTIFQICLPISGETISPINSEETRAVESGQGEKILIVDDNPDVRSTLKDIFSTLNYQVMTAENGHQGMKLLLADEEIRLLITDAIMPETSGLELIQSLRKMKNHIPAILITANPEIMGQEAQTYNYQLLRKPFDIVDLSHRARILLDQ